MHGCGWTDPYLHNHVHHMINDFVLAWYISCRNTLEMTMFNFVLACSKSKCWGEWAEPSEKFFITRFDTHVGLAKSRNRGHCLSDISNFTRPLRFPISYQSFIFIKPIFRIWISQKIYKNKKVNKKLSIIRCKFHNFSQWLHRNRFSYLILKWFNKIIFIWSLCS